MRPDRLRLRVIAACLGVVALALDALVPIHLAFDLGQAAAPARHREHAGDRDFIAALLTLVTGHQHTTGGNAPDKERRHDACAVCGAAATLAGFAPAAAPMLAAPAPAAGPGPGAPADDLPCRALLAAYRSRAPPLA